MKSIGRDVLKGYEDGIERGRLRTGLGLIELNARRSCCWSISQNRRPLCTISGEAMASMRGGWRLRAMKSIWLTFQRRVSVCPAS